MIRLALRNIFRHKTRSLITLSAIAFGCVSLIFVGGFFEDILFKMRESYIKAHTGHLQVTRKGFLTEGRRNPYAHLIEQPQELAGIIQQVPGVARVAQRLEFAGLFSTGETTMSCLGQGVEVRHEPTVRLSGTATARDDLPSMAGTVIEQGEPLSDEQPFGVIVGRGLAESLAIRPGDGLILVAHTVGGSINALDVIVRGIFYTSSQAFDDHYVRLPLATAQRLLHTQSAQALVVFLNRTEDTPRVREVLEQLIHARSLDVELRTWESLSDFYTKTKAFFSRLFFVLKLVIAIIAILSIYNTMNMAVLERTTEIGTIMALGLKRRRVLWLFLCEGGLLGALGGALGLAAGTVLTAAISRVGIPMPPPPGATITWHSEPLIDPPTLAFAFGLSLATALISSWYPAQKASRLEIAQALRHS